MRFASLLALLALFASPSFAQSPVQQQIPYQGLFSDGGVPLPDGSKTVQFRLTDADGGTWAETATVTTTNGLFSHRIGSVEVITGIDFTEAVSVTATYVPAVGSPVVFGPTPLGAVPFAYRTLSSDRVDFPIFQASPAFAALIQVANTGGGDAMQVTGAGDDGLQIAGVDGDGVYVASAGNYGVYVLDADNDGYRVATAGDDGVEVAAAIDDGVNVIEAGGYGIRSTGDDGNYLRTGASSTLSPDIILGGTSTSASGDNGVLSSDPGYSSSDLFFVSRDAVVIRLDVDNDENGEFEIRNGAGGLAWGVDESGTVTNGAALFTANAAVQIDDPTAPSARTLTLPSVVSDDRMVAFSGNATTDGSGRAVVTLPPYAEAIASDFRYQLTAIGSFAQAIVGEEVAGGRFAIRTSEPSVKVSWRIEGVRQDAWSEANAHVAIAQKAQPGTYVHPEAFGASPAQAVSGTVDAPSHITPEGQARLDAEAAEAAERESALPERVQDGAAEAVRPVTGQ